MTGDIETVVLYRPTGPEEIALVRASGNRRWPPRLPDQPIFYPVTNEDYAAQIARDWNEHGNCALVLGATWPEQLREVRAIVGDDVPFLVPGVGAQGGDVAAVVGHGANRNGDGLIISSSRGILYASSGDDYADAAAEAARTLRDEINLHR